LQYTSVGVDAFTETGAAALNVSADNAESLRSSLGARFRKEWQTEWGTLTSEWRASWEHEFLDKNRDLSASFADQALPGSFATTVAGSGTDFGVVGASLSGALSATTQISLSYDYKFGGNDFTDHQIMGRLSHQF
jgi:outer membrane autotransporter protein